MAVHPVAPRLRIEARSGEARSGGVTIRMIGFEGRLQWRRHQLFKLRAKPPQRKNYLNYNNLVMSPELWAERQAHPKFAIRSFFVRRTKNEQLQEQGCFRRPRSPPSSASAPFLRPASGGNHRS